MLLRKLVLISLVLVLSACQATAPKPDSSGYPAPAAEAPAAYPAPDLAAPAAVKDASVVINSVYPDLKDGETIMWTNIEAMAFNGEIAKIILSDTSAITVTLKDGRSFVSELPMPGLAETLVQSCGEVCKALEVVKQ